MPNLPRNDSRTDALDAAERKRRVQRVASAALYTVLVLVALYTARIFIPAVVWAIVIAIMLWPAFRWLERRPMFRGRHNLLAFVLTAALGLLFVVPY